MDAEREPRSAPSLGDPVSGAELAAFVEAVESRSVHAAADALDLTQSAVTKRLQRLERRLGVRLLERSRTGVTPTAAGRLLHPEARRALAALRHVEASAIEHRRGARLTLVVAASHTVGEFLLPDWLARFAAEHPGVHTQVQIVNSPGVLEALRDGHASIGFVEGRDPLDDMRSVVAAHDEIVVAVGEEHRWAGRRSVAPRELERESYVSRETGSGTRSVAESALEAVGVSLRPTLETASTQAIKRALLGGGFSLLSRLAVESELRAGTMSALPIRDVPLRRELRACHLRAVPPEGAAAALWRWLERHADEQATAD